MQQDWRECQKLLKSTGKNPLKRRLLTIDANVIDVGVAARAQEILQPYSVVTVQLISAGAATIYVWVTYVTYLIPITFLSHK